MWKSARVMLVLMMIRRVIALEILMIMKFLVFSADTKNDLRGSNYN